MVHHFLRILHRLINKFYAASKESKPININDQCFLIMLRFIKKGFSILNLNLTNHVIYSYKLILKVMPYNIKF